MLSDVTMGQFFPGKSVMHRLDPRIKMCMTVYFIVLIFCSKNFVTLGATILMSLLGVVLSKVPLKLAMMMTIALRFVPTLLEETEKIMAAQKARGADMESGGLMQRIKALIPVLIPLFVSAFRRAFDLATAMESRCYHGGEGRTKMKVLHLSKDDYITLIVCVLYLAAFITANILLPAAIVR